jgi:hypothetical protein
LTTVNPITRRQWLARVGSLAVGSAALFLGVNAQSPRRTEWMHLVVDDQGWLQSAMLDLFNRFSIRFMISIKVDLLRGSGSGSPAHRLFL